MCVYVFEVLAGPKQWNPDMPLAVRDGVNGKDIPKITSLFLMERDWDIKTRLVLFSITYDRNFFLAKLPNNL